MLRVCTSASDPDFATTGDVMAILFGSTTTGNVATTQEINYFGTLVRRASAWAETRLGYPLGLATYQETVPASGGRHLILARTPIVAVLRLFNTTSTGTATEFCSTDYHVEDAAAGLLARDVGFGWTQVEHYASDFSLGRTAARQAGMETRPWLVEYVAGYVPLGGVTTDSENYSTAGPNGTTTTAPTLPEDIRHAVALRAVEFQANPLGVRSRKVGDLAVEYATAGSVGQGRVHSAAEDLLAPYARLG